MTLRDDCRTGGGETLFPTHALAHRFATALHLDNTFLENGYSQLSCLA